MRASSLPPPSSTTRSPSHECLRNQLTHLRAIPAKYRRLSNLLPANRPSPNSHSKSNSYTRPAPTRDTSPATPSPGGQPRPSTPSRRHCAPHLRPSATAQTSRDTTPTVLTTSLPRARPSYCLPEMCTSSPFPFAQCKCFKRRDWQYGTLYNRPGSARHISPPGPTEATLVTRWGGLRLVLLSRGRPPGPGSPHTVLRQLPLVPLTLTLI